MMIPRYARPRFPWEFLAAILVGFVLLLVIATAGCGGAPLEKECPEGVTYYSHCLEPYRLTCELRAGGQAVKVVGCSVDGYECVEACR